MAETAVGAPIQRNRRSRRPVERTRSARIRRPLSVCESGSGEARGHDGPVAARFSDPARNFRAPIEPLGVCVSMRMAGARAKCYGVAKCYTYAAQRLTRARAWEM